MIEYTLDRLRDYGIEELVINVSYLKDQLMDYLSTFSGMAIKNIRGTRTVGKRAAD